LNNRSNPALSHAWLLESTFARAATCFCQSRQKQVAARAKVHLLKESGEKKGVGL